MSAGAEGRHLNFAFLADVGSRTLATCDEWDAHRWVTGADLDGLGCPANVRELARLALAAPGAPRSR